MVQRLRVGAALAILWAPGASGAAQADELAIRTAQGVVEGVRKEGVRVFLGIPYAAPPAGSLRFRAPEPHAPWSAPLDASRPPSSCPQTASDDPAGRASTDEDCLFLNVWAPPRARAPRPVMVWIHGGGFTEGNGAAPQYDGTHLAAFGGVVVVTVNYRVGPFGFLAAPALDRENPRGVSGNYGLLDQQAALRWVRENIGAFGGDAAKVTLFGESAGAMSVMAQLASPGAAGLFQRAIVQSSAFDGGAVPLAEAEKKWAEALAAVGCQTAADVAACLRAAPVEALLKAETGMPTPVIDGVVLPLAPPEAFRTGRFNRVPVMVGSTEKEYYLFTAREEAQHPAPALEWSGLAARLEHLPAAAARVVERYPAGEYANASSALATILGDAVFSCTADAMLRAASAYVPAYGFEIQIRDGFQQQPLAAGNRLLPQGVAYHTTDLGYVFNNRNDSSALTGRDLTLAHMIEGYWTRFAATGDPNGHAGRMPAVEWPRYRAATHMVLAITDAPALKTDFTGEHRCDLWNAAASR
jgi:para-nitrobenzyl esterase